MEGRIVKPQGSMRDRLEALPEILREALERAAEARQRLAQLDRLSEQEEESSGVERGGGDSFDYGESADELKAKQDIDRIKLDLDLAEDQAALACRTELGKTTDSHVRAVVGSNPEVVRLKRALIDAQGRYDTAKAERRLKRYQQRDRLHPTNRNLDTYYTERLQVQRALDAAEVDIEVARMCLETYKLLIAIGYAK